jgi:hypothetical protein
MVASRCLRAQVGQRHRGVAGIRPAMQVILKHGIGLPDVSGVLTQHRMQVERVRRVDPCRQRLLHQRLRRRHFAEHPAQLALRGQHGGRQLALHRRVIHAGARSHDFPVEVQPAYQLDDQLNIVGQRVLDLQQVMERGAQPAALTYHAGELDARVGIVRGQLQQRLECRLRCIQQACRQVLAGATAKTAPCGNPIGGHRLTIPVLVAAKPMSAKGGLDMPDQDLPLLNTP